jgi:predicted phosphodiesterase
MKLLILGDPHLKITRFDLASTFLHWIDNLIIELKPHAVVNLGDTFDTHAVLRSEIKCEFRAHVDFAIQNTLCNKYYYILGNHDFYKPKDSMYHALGDWEGIEGLTIVNKVYDNGHMTFVPYLPDHTKFPKDTSRICFAHQTFVGADYGNQRQEIGVVSEDVAAEIIISGHVHKPQEFGKVIYVGSAYSQGLDDVDQVKRVMLFDTETYERQYFYPPLPLWYKRSYELSNNFTVDSLHTELSTLDSKHHWVIEIVGPKAEILAYLNSSIYKKLTKSIDLRVSPVFTDNKKQRVQIRAVSVDGIVGEYLDKVYSGSLDKELIKRKTLELLSNLKTS